MDSRNISNVCNQCGAVAPHPQRTRCLTCGASLLGTGVQEPQKKGQQRKDAGDRSSEFIRIGVLILFPGVLATVLSWFIDPVFASVMGGCCAAALGLLVKPRIIVKLLGSRGAVADAGWVPARLVFRAAIVSAGFGCFGIGTGLLIAGPGWASVLISSSAFGIGAVIVSAAPDRSVMITQQNVDDEVRLIHRLLNETLRADGWAGIGAAVLCQPIVWFALDKRISFVAFMTAFVVIVGSTWMVVSQRVRLIWRFLLARVPKLIELIPNTQWIRRGSIFYTWVAFDAPDENGQTGKDRPVLCLAAVDGVYHAVALTSKDHTYRNDVIEIGVGPWDPKRRKSFVKLQPILTFSRRDVRRYACQLDDQRLQRVMSLSERINGPVPVSGSAKVAQSRSQFGWISLNTRLLIGQGIAVWLLLMCIGIAIRAT